MFVAVQDTVGRAARSVAHAPWLCHPAACYINNLYITKTDFLALADSHLLQLIVDKAQSQDSKRIWTVPWSLLKWIWPVAVLLIASCLFAPTFLLCECYL